MSYRNDILFRLRGLVETVRGINGMASPTMTETDSLEVLCCKLCGATSPSLSPVFFSGKVVGACAVCRVGCKVATMRQIVAFLRVNLHCMDMDVAWLPAWMRENYGEFRQDIDNVLRVWAPSVPSFEWPPQALEDVLTPTRTPDGEQLFCHLCFEPTDALTSVWEGPSVVHVCASCARDKTKAFRTPKADGVDQWLVQIEYLDERKTILGCWIPGAVDGRVVVDRPVTWADQLGGVQRKAAVAEGTCEWQTCRWPPREDPSPAGLVVLGPWESCVNGTWRRPVRKSSGTEAHHV